MATIKQIIHKETEQPIKILDVIDLLMNGYQISLDHIKTRDTDDCNMPIEKAVAVIKYVNDDANTTVVLDMKDMVLLTNTLTSKIKKELLDD